jgi:hypothetical protein
MAARPLKDLKIFKERLQDIRRVHRAALLSRDGTVVALRKGEPVTVPIGEYRMNVLSITLQDDQGGLPWTFIFSDNGGRARHKWYNVTKDSTQAVDPLGSLELVPQLQENEPACRAGDELRVNPRLYTSDGLLINTAYRGRSTTPWDSGCRGRVTLVGADGRVLASHDSGFA